MRFMSRQWSVLLLCAVATGVLVAQQTVKPGPCPPGQTEVRPGRCQAPEFPPPSIVDYRPKSTLVSDIHLVPKARFPVIDIHGHPGQTGLMGSGQGLASLMGSLDALNVRVMVSADNLSGDRLKNALALIEQSPYKDRLRIFTGINFSNVGPGWAEKAVAQLEADLKAGAVGVGEISKSLGLRTRKPDGSRLKVDDPELDPIWDACARLNIPVFIHTAEPQEFFQQPDLNNERWLELALFADRRNYQPGQVTFEELLTERDQCLPQAPEDAVHRGASRLARQ